MDKEKAQAMTKTVDGVTHGYHATIEAAQIEAERANSVAEKMGLEVRYIAESL